jgi:hypothetical protein
VRKIPAYEAESVGVKIQLVDLAGSPAVFKNVGELMSHGNSFLGAGVFFKTLSRHGYSPCAGQDIS